MDGITSIQVYELVEHLKAVPPTNLLLFDFVQTVLGEDGLVDENKVQFHMDQLLVAKAEAQAYIQGTTRLSRALKLCLSQEP